jgi:hypothetical protein
VRRNLSQEEEKQLDNEAYRFLLDNPHGRRILWKLISSCGVYSRDADNSGSWTYFKDGARSVGLNLIADICESDPEGYIKLQKSNLK